MKIKTKHAIEADGIRNKKKKQAEVYYVLHSK